MTFQQFDFATAAVLSQARSGASISLVMPCYNEAERLDAPLIVTFLQDHPEVQLVMVNDGSRDGTLDLLLAMREEAPGQITVLDLAQNAGKAEAVRQGLLQAVADGAVLTGYWDADLATPMEALPDFLRVAARFSDVEVIFGSRRRMLGHRIDRTLKRRLVSRLCSSMARLALGLPISDTQCGAKVLRTTDALRAAIAEPFTAGWLFDVELFSRIARATPAPRQAFYELPLGEWDEIAGSKVTGRAIVKAGVRMLGLIAQTRLGLGLGLGRGRAASGGTAAKARVVTSAPLPRQIAA